MLQHTILVTALLMMVLPVAAQELFVPEQVITELKAFYPDTTLVEAGVPRCVIVYPEEAEYEAVARQVAAAIKTATGADVPMKTATQYQVADRDTNLICLGRMNNNKLALDLYIWRFVASDDWFPGPDGYEFRTVCDPWGNGHNVVMLGGSALEGVRKAVEQFIATLPTGQTLVIPRTIRTAWKGIENLDAFTEARIDEHHREFIDLKALPYQAERRIVDCAELYYLTGRDEFADAYARMLRRWMDEYYIWTPERQITTPKYIIPDIMQTYDLIEESPLIADDLKLELTNLLYDYCSRLGVHSRITGLKPGILSSIGLHDVSESVTYAASYFHRYYPEVDFERLDKGVADVRIGQETMANSNGVIDNDGGYTPAYPTAAMRLALALENHDFFTKGAARKWMEYSMLVADSWGSSFYGHSPSSAIAAWYYQDPRYVWFNNWRSGRSEYHPEMTEKAFNRWMWSYLPKMDEQVPEEMVGVRHMPLHETNYKQMEQMGKFINVSRERSFHQLTMREGFGRDDQYLRLDGINDGITNGGDGNSISWVSDGRGWMTNVGKWGGGSNMKWFNTALVLREGQMSDRLVALCDLQLSSELPTSAFVRSVMNEYNGMEWARNIAWIKGKYWVIMDQFLAQEPDDYSVMCQWFHGARTVDEQYRAIQTTVNHTLVLQALGGTKPFVTFLDDGRAIVRQGTHGQMAAGDEVTMAHLLYGHPKEEDHAYSARRVADNLVLVTEPQRQVLIGLSELSHPDDALMLGGLLRVRCTMFVVADDEMSFAGVTWFGAGQQPLVEADNPMDVHVDFSTGLVTAIATEPTTVRLRGLQATEEMVTATTQGGVSEVQLEPGQYQTMATFQAGPLAALVAAVRAGIAQAAQMTAASAQETQLQYPRGLTEQWQFQVPEGDDVPIQVVRAADLDGDGVAEVLVGTADGRLFCLNADGSERWQTRFEPHPEQQPSREQDKAAVNDIAVADFGDGPRVLVASDSQYLHCLDADGQEIWKYTGIGFQCTNQAPGEYGVGRYIEGDGEMMVIHVEDLDGDGNLEILAGSKTFMHGNRRVFGTLWCLEPDGQLRWHLYQSGGTVTSIATLDSDGDGQKMVTFGTGGGTYGRSSYVCDNQGQSAVRLAGPYGEKYMAAGTLAADGTWRLVRLEHRDGTVNVYDVADPHELRWSFRAGGMDAAGPEVVDLNGDGIAEIVVGSDGGSLFCLNEGDNPLIWRTNLGEPISAVATGDLGLDTTAIVVGSAVGGVTVVAADGTPLAYANVEAPVEYVSAMKLHPDAAGVAVAGTADGTVTFFALQ
ncbi:MAG: PQQ-like beta-propeller repeat protein [candidate division WS1 bacterium]|nr:PQQ-like beta-propeller repeat protein [candidate division WS1 bacterium]